jgi:hypothetical protein
MSEIAIGTRGPIPEGGYPPIGGYSEPEPQNTEPTPWDIVRKAWEDAIIGNEISGLGQLSLEQLERSAEAVVALRKEITKARNAAKRDFLAKAKFRQEADSGELHAKRAIRGNPAKLVAGP